jgi:hypothetical protein
LRRVARVIDCVTGVLAVADLDRCQSLPSILQLVDHANVLHKKIHGHFEEHRAGVRACGRPVRIAYVYDVFAVLVITVCS